MKTINQTILIVLSVFLSFSIFAQDKHSFTVGDFDAIHISGGFQVVITKGSKTSVEVETKESNIDKMKVEVEGNTLKVGVKKGVHDGFKAKVFITYVELDKLVSSGSSDVKVEGGAIKGKELELVTSGSGNIKAEVSVESLKAKSSGSGDFDLSGKATEVTFTLSGSGDVDGLGLSTDVTNIRISGSGNVSIGVKESLDVQISGSGDVVYKGSPKRQKVKVSGSGDVRQVD